MASFGIAVAIVLAAGAVFFAAAGSLVVTMEWRRADGSMIAKLRLLAQARLGPVTRRHAPRGMLEALRLRIVRAGDPRDLKPEEVIWLQLLLATMGGLVGAVAGRVVGGWQISLLGAALGGALPL
ncbi:MAG TPA: hypothetical protein VGD74_02705, partial [Vulgatibacter sp.]